MKKFVLLSAFILMISLSVNSQDNEAFFKGSFENAIAKAKQNDKFVLIDFHTVWCGACKTYDEYVFSKPEVISYLRDKFVALSIDAEKGEGINLRKIYEITSYPQIIIAYPDGKEIDRITGYDSSYSENIKEFINKINGILDGTSSLSSLENDVRTHPTNLALKEKLILEYFQREQYSKIPHFAKDLIQTKDLSLRDKGELYCCLALIEDKGTRDPKPMIELMNKKTSLVGDYIATGYSALLSYYQRNHDNKNVDHYYQKVIEAVPENWYYKKKYALFLFENNLNILEAQKIAEEYYNSPGVIDHYQPLLMAYSFASKNEAEKGMQIFDDWMKKYKHDKPLSDKQWAYFFYADFANKHNIRLEAALKYAREILNFRSGDFDLKITFARLLYKNGKSDEAVNFLKRCLENVQSENHYNKINELLKEYSTRVHDR